MFFTLKGKTLAVAALGAIAPTAVLAQSDVGALSAADSAAMATRVTDLCNPNTAAVPLYNPTMNNHTCFQVSGVMSYRYSIQKDMEQEGFNNAGPPLLNNEYIKWSVRRHIVSGSESFVKDENVVLSSYRVIYHPRTYNAGESSSRRLSQILKQNKNKPMWMESKFDLEGKEERRLQSIETTMDNSNVNSWSQMEAQAEAARQANPSDKNVIELRFQWYVAGIPRNEAVQRLANLGKNVKDHVWTSLIRRDSQAQEFLAQRLFTEHNDDAGARLQCLINYSNTVRKYTGRWENAIAPAIGSTAGTMPAVKHSNTTVTSAGVEFANPFLAQVRIVDADATTAVCTVEDINTNCGMLFKAQDFYSKPEDFSSRSCMEHRGDAFTTTTSTTTLAHDVYAQSLGASASSVTGDDSTDIASRNGLLLLFLICTVVFMICGTFAIVHHHKEEASRMKRAELHDHMDHLYELHMNERISSLLYFRHVK